MKALVLGGLGFCGSHLVEHLVRIGDEVTIVDSGLRPTENWESPAGVSVYREDASRFLGSTDKVYDEVYHLASVVGPVSLLREPVMIAKSMVEDLYALIDYCKRSGSKMLYVSTSEVYGGTSTSNHEDDPCIFRPAECSPRMEYAAGKLLDEVVVRNTPNLHAVVVRPFNISGARQGEDGGFVMPRLVKQALCGEPMTVYGTGSDVRCFTHAKDVVRGFVTALRKGTPGSIYNIGNPGNRITILKLAQAIKSAASSSSEITLVNPQTLWGPLFREAYDKIPDISKAISELKWEPLIPLEEIISDVVDEHSMVEDERRKVNNA